MDLSIVIVNWNTKAFLAECLKAVDRTSGELSIEVFVVDNFSSDGSSAMVHQDFPNVHLIENHENMGFARANNLAIHASQGKYVLLLNSDAFVEPDAVGNMVQVMDKYTDVGIAGGNLFYPDGRVQISYGPLPTLVYEIGSLLSIDKIFAEQNPGNRTADYIETGTVCGACLLVRHSVLDQIGLLDEDYFMFNEEVDLCLRAHQAGWKVVHVPGARIIHIGGGSTGLTPKRYLMLYQGKLRYFHKHYGRRSQRLLFTAIRFSTFIKVCLYSLLRNLKPEGESKDRLWRGVAAGLGELQI